MREDGFFWRGRLAGDPPEWTWQVNEELIKWPKVRQRWELLRMEAKSMKFQLTREMPDTAPEDSSS